MAPAVGCSGWTQAIHTIRAAWLSNGTMNMRTLATDRVRADSRIQGRAFPAGVLVRSMSCPTMRLAATMRMVESSWRAVRNPRSSFNTLVR